MSIHRHCALRQAGLTMVELVMFIVIISVGIAGILIAMDVATRRSADPLARKQALAIAEALLEEVQMMPFTLCEPDEFVADASPCPRNEAIGPEGPLAGMNQPALEVRGSLNAPFDNVNDYNGLVVAGGDSDLGNSPIVTVPAGYTATVVVTGQPGLGVAGQTLPQAAVLQITVTVSYGNESIVLEGYRTRYAPDAAVIQ